ncbi:DNA cytosine methyltransferase [Oribacterium sinus]|uniref:DNA (cytosine-5-)-methyltransferase n=1 Tax=Oribacterium sinus TaxID=237576 RepID=A0A930GVR0_9FIRM|nr:DNA cytosine methyltransferase [Oribacterium sinus]MBF1272459.1 DNA cytosine methyltransferase [Oribacterium sinus]
MNELFAGIGAFRKALINIDIPHKIVGISEVDKFAIKSYQAMYGETRNYGDISKVERLDYADLWTYGFPCQDISLAGKKQGIVKGKTRSGLLHEVERLLEVAKEERTLPKYLILENVKNLLSERFKGDFEKWVEYLSDLGYETKWEKLTASDYGIPQKRERVFAVSIRKDLYWGFQFPKPTPLRVQFKDLLEESPSEKYFLTDTFLKYCMNHEENHDHKLGLKFTPIPRLDCTVSKTIVTKEGSRVETNFIIESDGGIRRLSPRECWRLMGFNDRDFEKAQSVCSDTQLYKQAGNSICVNVLEAIFKELLK